MNQLKLTGLDAQNPLAYLAALGVLRIADDWCARSGAERPRLSFVDEGRKIAVLRTPHSYDELVSIVLEDAAEQSKSGALGLAYDDSGSLVAPGTPSMTQDLKPAPSAARAFLNDNARRSRRDADLAGGLFSELVQDNNGNTKPTALHFTAGQQTFLSMVEQLRCNVGADALSEALLGPWKNTSPLPSLSWDSSVSRSYALRASDPSKEKRGSVPAANWLGVHALAFFPTLPVSTWNRPRLLTTGVLGGWKDSVFTWAVWTPFLTSPTIASLLRINQKHWTARERAALGVSAVMEARILRSDQGGYGSFAPCGVVPPHR